MKFVSELSKVWLRFTKSINGKEVKFRWEQLSSHRYQEFIDYKMKHYVNREVTHVLAGIYKSPTAMKEYKKIVTKSYKDPSYHTAICCIDDDTNKMIGFSSLKLYRKGEIYKDFMLAETAEVQNFYKILHEWNNLCPVSNILRTYGVDKYFDDAGYAIHPDYRGCKFSHETSTLRQNVCKANDIPLTGAWMTSTAVQNITHTEDWETIYEISSEKLGNLLGIKFSKPQMFVYRIKKIV